MTPPCSCEEALALASEVSALQERVRELEGERDAALGVCGGGHEKLSGCGEQFHRVENMFRCTYCDVPFHRACAKKHFERDSGPTLEQRIADLEAREKLVTKACRDWEAQVAAFLGVLEETPENVEAVALVVANILGYGDAGMAAEEPECQGHARDILAALRERSRTTPIAQTEGGGG